MASTLGRSVLMLYQSAGDSNGSDVIFKEVQPLALLLGDRGFQLRLGIIGPRDSHLEALASNAGLGLSFLGGYAPWALPFTLGRLRNLFKTSRFHLVNANEPIPAIVAGMARSAGLIQCPIIHFRRHSEGRRRLMVASRVASRFGDVTVVATEIMAGRASFEDGLSRDRLRVVPRGVPSQASPDSGDSAAYRDALGIPHGNVVVGTVSRLRRVKGVDVLLRAAVRLRNGVQGGCFFVIVGDGPEKNHLMDLASQLRLDNVLFAGHSRDVAKWLSALDIFVQPSRSEAFGVACIEAMSAGLPVVATSVGGVPEVVRDGATGILVPADDADALAMAISTLVQKPDLRAVMGAEGRRTYESRFTVNQLAVRYAELWDDVLDKLGGRQEE